MKADRRTEGVGHAKVECLQTYGSEKSICFRPSSAATEKQNFEQVSQRQDGQLRGFSRVSFNPRT